MRIELASEQSGPWHTLDKELDDANRVYHRRTRRRFKLDESVWAPRKSGGNSHDYFETAAAMRHTFNTDWALAVKAHGLQHFIETSQTKARDEAEGTNVFYGDFRASEYAAREVDEAREAIWQYHQLFYGAFDYYALQDPVTDEWGEADIYGVSFNSFLALIRNMGWESRNCPMRLFEIIFKQVNAVDDATKDVDTFNALNKLARHEFLQALVRIAVTRYVVTLEIKDVSDAIAQCGADMECHLDPEALQRSNLFRARYCCAAGGTRTRAASPVAWDDEHSRSDRVASDPRPRQTTTR